MFTKLSQRKQSSKQNGLAVSQKLNFNFFFNYSYLIIFSINWCYNYSIHSNNYYLRKLLLMTYFTLVISHWLSGEQIAKRWNDENGQVRTNVQTKMNASFLEDCFIFWKFWWMRWLGLLTSYSLPLPPHFKGNTHPVWLMIPKENLEK